MRKAQRWSGRGLKTSTVGKMLEAAAKGKTTSSIRGLMALSPETVILLKDGKETEVPVAAVKKGDIFVLKSIHAGTEKLLRTLENCSQRNTDDGFGKYREILLFPLIDRRTDKVKLLLGEVLCKGLEGMECINQIAIRRILHNLIQPIAALELDSKTLDTILRPERSDQRNAEDSHGTTGGNEGTHQFLIGSRSGENPDTLFAILFRQVLAHEEELLIDHQIMGGDYFFGLEEGIADLLVQLGIVIIA